MPAARVDEGVQMIDVARIVSEKQLVAARVSPFDMDQGMKELGMLSQSTRDSAQPADVLGMSPARVVAPAVGVGDERDWHSRRG